MRRLAVLCAILLCLAGCGDDDDEDPSRSVTVNPNSTVTITGDVYSFDPGRVVVRGAGPLTIRLRNAGDLAHNLRLQRNGEDVGGTPTFEATSNVLRSYARSDARVFECPCPECGHQHEITWADIHWPEGGPDRAHYVCPECGSVIEERHKAAMVANGRWRATAPR
jgi:predicted RNA-binding Zn-ribbon protein involved in translation (DUF1610 family)